MILENTVTFLCLYNMFLYHLKKEFFNLVNFQLLTPPVAPHSPKGVINGFREKCPIWMFFIIWFSILWKKEFFNSAKIQKISPKITFSKIPENRFSIWTCGALSPSFKVLGRKPCPGAMEQTRKQTNVIFKHRECFHFYCKNSGGMNSKAGE